MTVCKCSGKRLIGLPVAGTLYIVWGMLFAYAAYGMAEAQAVSAKHA